MSKPRYWWWASVRQAIRQYPALKQRKADLQSSQVTKSVTSIRGPDGKLHDFYPATGGGGNSRTVERLALVELPPAEERILNAVERAMELAELAPNGKTRAAILREYHFRGGRLVDIADRHYVGEATAKRWNALFMRTVAAEMGFTFKASGKAVRGK